MIGILAAAAIASASGAATEAVEETPFLCQSDLPRVNGQVVAWFNLLLNEQQQPVRRELFVRTRQFDATWSVDAAGRIGKMLTFSHHYRPTAATTPSRIAAVVDGKESESTPLADLGANLIITQASVPDIFCAKRLSFRPYAADGKPGAETSLDLPDWAWLRSHTPEAVKQSEAARLAGRCQLSIVP